MIHFLGDGNGWLVLGLISIILEMLLVLSYISISFGVGALVTGLLVKTDLLPTALRMGFVDEILVFGVISSCALILIRKIFKKSVAKDINTY
jgi:membrane protein implicated in regulation of membrane protease activity